MPEFSIIIPQHGQSELTQPAVESLLATQTESMEIVIVDDGSPRDEFTSLRTLTGSNLSLIRVPHRQGVTRAWNLGARQTTGTTLIFLNNDTVSTGPWLRILAGSVQGGSALLAGPERRTERQLADPSHRLLKGWCLAIQRETFLSIGMFDERFRLYFSDTDLQLRLQQQRPDALACCTGLSLRHLGRSSTRLLAMRRTEWQHDRDRFRQKWHLPNR